MNDIYCGEQPSFFQLIRKLTAQKDKSRAIRYQGNVSLAFPKQQVQAVVANANKYWIKTNIMGFIGATGILPLYYTAILLEQLKQKKTALQDLIDILHHRHMENSYAYWEKTKPFMDYENKKYQLIQTFMQYLGQGEHTPMPFMSYYAYFINPNVSIERLKQLLKQHCHFNINIKNQIKKIERLPNEKKSRLSRKPKDCQNHCLGYDWCLGQTIRLDHAYCLVQIILDSPQTYDMIIQSNLINELYDLIRCYCGITYQFTIQLVLDKKQRTGLQLSSNNRLGFNSYLMPAKITSA